MALFGSKKNTEEKAPKAAAVKKAAPAKAAKPAKAKAIKTSSPAVITDGSELLSARAAIIRPHITEKAGLASQSGVYTFEIAVGANKHTVAKAIKALYKVVPVKVAIINLPAKKVFVRGRRGVVSGIRKAVVTLKKGETINLA